MLTFTIPTWNRANELKQTVYSIAQQIEQTGYPCQILISNNCSDDRTPQIIEELKAKWPFVKSTQTETHGSYSDSFRHAIQQTDTEWCWLFGDDDLLLPNALRIIWPHLTQTFDFICACTDVRATETYDPVGTLFDLCNQYGFLDVIGFMSSCVFKAKPIIEATKDQSWDVYAQASFVHSCAFLDRLGGKEAIILDYPMVGNQEEWSAETGDRWISEKIFERFFGLDDCLQHLFYKGCFPKLLSTNFLRYHTYNVWDKLIGALLNEYHSNGNMPSDHMFLHVRNLADLLEDKLAAKQLRQAVDDAKRLCLVHQSSVQAFQNIDYQFRTHADQQSEFTKQYALVSP